MASGGVTLGVGSSRAAKQASKRRRLGPPAHPALCPALCTRPLRVRQQQQQQQPGHAPRPSLLHHHPSHRIPSHRSRLATTTFPRPAPHASRPRSTQSYSLRTRHHIVSFSATTCHLTISARASHLAYPRAVTSASHPRLTLRSRSIWRRTRESVPTFLLRLAWTRAVEAQIPLRLASQPST